MWYDNATLAIVPNVTLLKQRKQRAEINKQEVIFPGYIHIGHTCTWFLDVLMSKMSHTKPLTPYPPSPSIRSAYRAEDDPVTLAVLHFCSEVWRQVVFVDVAQQVTDGPQHHHLETQRHKTANNKTSCLTCLSGEEKIEKKIYCLSKLDRKIVCRVEQRQGCAALNY